VEEEGGVEEEPVAASFALFHHPVIEEPIPDELSSVPDELPNGFKLPRSKPPRILLVFLFLFGILYYSIRNYNIIIYF
jgi:hypothetical protein